MTALLRLVRQQRGMTHEELAAETGLTKSYLSKVERQRSTPSIAVAIKVARALDVDVAQLFSDNPEAHTLSIDRAGDRPSGRYHALASEMLGKTMSPFVVRPTRAFAEHPHPAHAGQEIVYVVSGAVEMRYADETITLEVGDCAYFDSSLPHQLRRIGSPPTEVIVVTSALYPRSGSAATS